VAGERDRAWRERVPDRGVVGVYVGPDRGYNRQHPMRRVPRVDPASFPTIRQNTPDPGGVVSSVADMKLAHGTLPASKERINKAGDALRITAEKHRKPGQAHREAVMLVRAYRATHAYPLTAITAGLRHHARNAADGTQLDISQRLKQLATITDKLVRMPKSRLARMPDIGGCRATFVDQGKVDAAITSIERRARNGMAWVIVDIDDYVGEHSRRDGYRAKHVIVRKYGVQIEMQFRTTTQHNWAELVENLDKAAGLGLKSRRVDLWAIDAVASAADDMRRYEQGQVNRDSLIEALNSSLKPILELAGGATIT
jgi:ppGpp synthetase/RelA/SpoT-type nucleotidyltranferase